MDAVSTAIMNNRFNAIVEEASAAIYRTAHTTFVKMVQDYQCAIATKEGDIFAYPSQSGVNVFIGTPLQKTIEVIGLENIEPGDLFIMNDPFSTEGLVTHLMDVTMLYPIFHEEELVAFGWSFVHATDIGGAIPGSISPAFHEVFQEGIRLRPAKLLSRGKLNETLKNLFMDNSRIPEELWGDFQAMVSGLKSMAKRLQQLCDKYGRAEISQSMQDVLAYGEAKAREVVSRIPDGEYAFSDYLEGIEPGQLAHVSVKLTVAGSDLHVDYSGTDPQMPAAYNMVSGQRTHPYIVQALISFILTQEPLAPRNAGLLRPIHTHAPSGSILNAVFPASGGARAASATRAYDALLGCLNQALPDGLAAAGAGMAGIIVAAAPDPRTGRLRVSTISPIVGGSGGRSGVDGVDGMEVRYGALRNVPTEILEIETSLMIRSVRLVSDSLAPGEFTGGAAVAIEMESLAEEAMVTVRSMNRFRFSPWGVRGGHHGRTGKTILNPDTTTERSVGIISQLTLKRGDVLRITSPSGGGFGSPYDRSPEKVHEDYRRGLISSQAAWDQYGVAIDNDGELDASETVRRRSDLHSAGIGGGAFTFCEERLAQDVVWPREIRNALAQFALDYDPSISSRMVDLIHRRQMALGKRMSISEIRAALSAEAARNSQDRHIVEPVAEDAPL
ncbi:hydantoinase B/oxoprolinase family protein [Agrobacterium fabrum]|uniref:hydantoinase B/oxoprolinase family protein n=1 Tax=Agrobacterium fabrum TaxID=1176649 RepID=UPI0015736DD2|nr:hydantoinase B/oxoprolinase family protein [Agrobacterium fabrum]WCK80085.1 hydantoinase B/oxoprolinase family protein [Agrobacterium fabrum]